MGDRDLSAQECKIGRDGSINGKSKGRKTRWVYRWKSIILLDGRGKEGVLRKKGSRGGEGSESLKIK